MFGIGTNGNAFRTSNKRNAQTFIAEKTSSEGAPEREEAPERLPKTWVGRISLLVVVAAVVVAALLMW